MDTMEIKKIVAKKLSEGMPLGDILKLLADEHKVTMTFLELRLLASELEDVNWEAMEPEEEEPEEAEPEKPEAEEEVTGHTTVEVSKLTRPGAVAHGSVNFGSGAKADWTLDQMGRLGLSNAEGEPTQEDIQEFQEELQKALTGQG